MVAAVAQGLPTAPHLSLAQKSAYLIHNKGVRQKVQISDSQFRSFLSLASEHGKAQEKILSEKDPSEADFQKTDRTFAQKALATLKPDQRAGLLRVTIERVGAGALLDAEIAKTVGISATQSKAIAAILAGPQKKLKMLDEGMTDTLSRIPEGGSAEARNQAHQAVVKSYQPERERLAAEGRKADKKALALLNAAQLKRWTALAS